MPDGWFYVLPEIDVKKLEKLFRHKVFKMLIREKKINRELVDKLLSWKNSGFNIHNQVKIQTHDSHHRGLPNILSRLADCEHPLPPHPSGATALRSPVDRRGTHPSRSATAPPV